jgi:hypothetical protein
VPGGGLARARGGLLGSPLGRRAHAGGARERRDRPFEVRGDRLKLGQRVEVAEQAEA